MENQLPEVIDFDALCSLLMASRPTVKAMEKRGEGPPCILIGQRRRYLISAVKRWLDEQAIANKAV